MQINVYKLAKLRLMGNVKFISYLISDNNGKPVTQTSIIAFEILQLFKMIFALCPLTYRQQTTDNNLHHKTCISSPSCQKNVSHSDESVH